MDWESTAKNRASHAQIIAMAGGINNAIESGSLPRNIDTTLAEALVLGLLRQDVSRFVCILGHGSTEVGEVLRIYEKEGLCKTYPVRNEIEAGHAAAALRWVTGEKAAVVTSIGPGALQALAASVLPASNGLGVYYLLGDETCEDEGPNMQQIPKAEQGLFHRLFSIMGQAYSLHTPWALSAALRRGINTVDHPHRGGPFFMLMPLNTQPTEMNGFNLDELPLGAPPKMGPAFGDDLYLQAVKAVSEAKRVMVKAGGGSRGAGPEIAEFCELADAVVVQSPLASGVVPYDNPRNMTVGGSKGSISGNFAMEETDLLVAVGTRAVCQSDSSRTSYPKAKGVIAVNTEIDGAFHYNKTIGLVGDAALTLAKLNALLKAQGINKGRAKTDWMAQCEKSRNEWIAFKNLRYDTPVLYDEMWKREVLTQPAAIRAVTKWARAVDGVCFFDAGDVQANGFQLVEDDRIGRTYTDTGASYMGFAVSALLSTALTDKPFYGVALTGDGSFMMNPQILLDGVAHGATGCIVLFDNRRMAAISSLQDAQYAKEFATNDNVEVDYVAMAKAFKGVEAFDGGLDLKSLANALDKARAHEGLSLIHVPVYYGPNELGGLGAFGRWNVGNWVNDVQSLRHKIGL